MDPLGGKSWGTLPFRPGPLGVGEVRTKTLKIPALWHVPLHVPIYLVSVPTYFVGKCVRL